MAKTLEDKIRLKRLEISVEQDPERKQELQKQLVKLNLRLELEKLNQSHS
jgi:hypothetical protein